MISKKHLAVLALAAIILPSGLSARTAAPVMKPLVLKPVSFNRTPAPAAAMPNMPKVIKKRAGGAKNWKQLSPKLIEASNGAITAQLIANAIKKRLDGKSVGFSVTVMVESGGKGSASGGLARSAPDSGQRGWKSTDRITIASVSKSFTAAAMMRVLASKGLSVNSKIGPYLPTDMPLASSSSKFKDITFAELMNHTSGIRNFANCVTDAKGEQKCEPNGCGISYNGLRNCVYNGIFESDKTYLYQNENSALLRVLMPRVYGNNPTDEAAYAKDYEVIVNRMVMNSAGIPYATCSAGSGNVALSYEAKTDNGKDSAPENAAAVNYDWSSLKPGIDWGDMSLVCGSQGWNLSSDDLAKMAHALQFTDKILPQATVDTMRDNNLGMFYSDFGGGYDGYGHGGWHPAGWNNGEINTWSFAFNKGVAIGLVINSRYNGNYSWDVAAAVKEVLDTP